MSDDRIKWLESRRRGIGGSDAAAVLGLSRYKSALDVWRDKKGLSDPVPDNDAMHWGNVLEPVVIAEYERITGNTVTTGEPMLECLDVSCAIASLDGRVKDKGIIVEAKTARHSKSWGDVELGQIPIEYLCQVQHYMLVTGYEMAHVPVLIAGSDFRIYEIPRDERIISIMSQRYPIFWKMVEDDVPPEPKTLADVVYSYKYSNGEQVEASETAAQSVEELIKIRQTISELEEIKDSLELRVKSEMKDAEALIYDGKAIATWKSTKPRASFDTASFKAAHPELHKQYIKETPVRRFTIAKEL